MMSTPQVRQTLVFSGEAEAGAVPQGGTIYSLETGDFRNLTAAEAQSLYQGGLGRMWRRAMSSAIF